MRIIKTEGGLAREPLSRPFGFKGGYLNELWHPAVKLTASSGSVGVGCGVQSVLWSDAEIFRRHDNCGGNAMMLSITARALELAKEVDWFTPVDLLDVIMPELTAYARQICVRNDLRLTFVLNALVPVDNAAWMLYAAEHGLTGFDAMIPAEWRIALLARHERLAAVPLLTYVLPDETIGRLADQGYAMFKIKLGADPDGNGDRAAMLAWDKERLTRIHRLLSSYRTPHTATGKVAYYLDANGRYDTRDRLLRLLEHADRIGCLEQVLILEEPFEENNDADVADLPVLTAADESAHSNADTIRRLDQGYRAVAVKAIAKTLSMSLKIMSAAAARQAHCFCADLTAPPVLLEWNRAIAARLPALPGMNCGILESNGKQNYCNWKYLCAHHPHAGADWIKAENGIFRLSDDYYRRDGGMLEIPVYYSELAEKGFVEQINQ